MSKLRMLILIMKKYQVELWYCQYESNEMMYVWKSILALLLVIEPQICKSNFRVSEQKIAFPTKYYETCLLMINPWIVT